MESEENNIVQIGGGRKDDDTLSASEGEDDDSDTGGVATTSAKGLQVNNANAALFIEMEKCLQALAGSAYTVHLTPLGQFSLIPVCYKSIIIY